MNTNSKKSGFSKVLNQMLEALAKSDLSGAQFRIVCWVMRDTIGWQREMSRISHCRLSRKTEMTRSMSVCHVKKLTRRRILRKEKTPEGKNVLGINPNIDEWILRSPKNRPGMQTDTTLVCKHDSPTGMQTRTPYPIKQIRKQSILNKEHPSLVDSTAKNSHNGKQPPKQEPTDSSEVSIQVPNEEDSLLDDLTEKNETGHRQNCYAPPAEQQIDKSNTLSKKEKKALRDLQRQIEKAEKEGDKVRILDLLREKYELAKKFRGIN